MPGIASRSIAFGDWRLLTAALAALLCIQLSFYQHPAWLALGGVGAAVVGLSLSRWRLIALLAGLALVHTAWQQHLQHQQRWPAPRQSSGEFRLQSLQVQADRVRLLLRDEHKRLLRVSAYAPSLEGLNTLSTGDCIQATLRLRPAQGTINWVGFDYGRWLYSQGIDGIGSLREWRPCSGPRPNSPFQATSPDPGMALLRALIYADRGGFTANIWSTLARTGLSHLFAISGLHLGLLGAWGWLLGRWLWQRAPRLRQQLRRSSMGACSAALGMSAYMLLAHEQLSAWRAWSMALMLLALLGLGRRASPLAVWSAALLGVLLLAPLQSLHASFWLSFSAVLLLLASWPWLAGCSWTMRLLATQLLLGVALAPMCWAWFGQWSAWGLLFNLILVPALGVVLPLCLGAALLAELGLWAAPLDWLARGLNQVYRLLEAAAQVEPAVWPLWTLSLLEASLLLAGLVALLLVFGARLAQVKQMHSGLRWGFLLGVGLWGLMLGLAMRPASPPTPSQAEVWLLDVGQGSAAIVRSATKVVVIDSGPRSRNGAFDAGEMVLLPQLRALGLGHIDLLITTHEDRDHAGGRAALEGALDIRQQWGERGVNCQQEQSWTADGVDIRSIEFERSAHWSRNNRSCVILLEVDGVRMLFPGDVEAQAERAMLNHPQLLQGAQLVVVPHHGSLSSSTPEWVELLQSQLALVPAGSFNRWGFPRPAVVQRWQASGSRVLSTAEGGAIHIRLPDLSLARPAARPWRLEAL